MSFITTATKSSPIRDAAKEGASPAPTQSRNNLRAPSPANSRVEVANFGRAI